MNTVTRRVHGAFAVSLAVLAFGSPVAHADNGDAQDTAERFRARDQQLGEGPHIAAGSSPRRHADRFRAPVALFHGTLDVNVDVRHSRAMADALKDTGRRVEYIEFDDLQHNLGDSKARVEMLSDIDAFLASASTG